VAAVPLSITGNLGLTILFKGILIFSLDERFDVILPFL
jgi:hypothetical protein